MYFIIFYHWLTENDPKAKELEKKQQQRIYESFRTGPFEDIVARSEAKVSGVYW